MSARGQKRTWRRRLIDVRFTLKSGHSGDAAPASVFVPAIDVSVRVKKWSWIARRPKVDHADGCIGTVSSKIIASLTIQSSKALILVLGRSCAG